MGMVRITEAELAGDPYGVLDKVKAGAEIIIERDHSPVAVIKPSGKAGRMISEVIAELEARGSAAVIDDEFARDIEAGIEAQSQPWRPPTWE